mmetsp:Transcript_4207/g.5920  ORF Transcript_4207/g.5920 Transcript_4207/m.5920 type:complete len:192 (+) Transcript_4207:2-577(+)
MDLRAILSNIDQGIRPQAQIPSDSGTSLLKDSLQATKKPSSNLLENLSGLDIQQNDQPPGGSEKQIQSASGLLLKLNQEAQTAKQNEDPAEFVPLGPVPMKEKKAVVLDPLMAHVLHQHERDIQRIADTTYRPQQQAGVGKKKGRKAQVSKKANQRKSKAKERAELYVAKHASKLGSRTKKNGKHNSRNLF